MANLAACVYSKENNKVEVLKHLKINRNENMGDFFYFSTAVYRRWTV